MIRVTIVCTMINIFRTEPQFVREAFRFSIVGVVSTIINYAIFYVLFSFLYQGHVLSSAVGFLIGIGVSYSLNRIFTFKSDSTKVKKELLLYITVCLISLSISLSILEVLVTYVGINPLIANLLCIGVSTVTNFVGVKKIVF